MKVLVAGAAGYIGSMLVPRLLHRDWRVTAFDRFSSGAPVLGAVCADKNLDIIRGDVHEINPKLLDRHDCVINLADARAAGRIAGYLSPEQMMVQLVGSGALECMLPNARMFLESGAITLRLGTVFGMSPRMRLDLPINAIAWKAVSNATPARQIDQAERVNAIHVRDLVAAVLHVIDNYPAMQGREFSPRDLEATGWEARHSLDAGIGEMMKGMRMMIAEKK